MTRHPRRIVRRLGAALSLAGILVGLPAVLAATAGRPTLEGLPDLAWVQDGLEYRYFQAEPLLRALALVAWVLWAYAAVATMLRAVAALAVSLRVAGGRSLLTVSNLIAVRPVRSLIDAAIGVALLASTTTSSQQAPDPRDPAPVVVTVQPQTLAFPSVHDTNGDPPRLIDSQGNGSGEQATAELAAAIPPEPDTACSDAVHIVRPGESYWSIARDRLGDPYRWPTIFELNRGRRMPDGAVVERAGLIQPGWGLYLPPTPAAPNTPPPTPTPPSPPPQDQAPRPPPTPPAETPTIPPSPQPDAPADDGSIHLPSGSVIAVSFAAGMATAVALARLRARRRYKPGATSPEVNQGDSGLSDTMRQILQRLPPAERPGSSPSGAHPPLSPLGDDQPPSLQRHLQSRQPTGSAHAAGEQPLRDRPSAPSSHPTRPGSSDQAETPGGTVVRIGTRDGTPVLIDLAEYPSVSILGPGADGLVRVIVTALLAANGPHALQVRILGPPPWAGVRDFPGLQHALDVDAALRELERELLRRTRLLDAADASDLDVYRDDPHGEPIPNLLLVVAPEVVEQHPQRLHALVDQGHRLGITALLIDARLPEPGAVLQVDDGGQPVAATPAVLLDDLDRTRLHTITDSEATDLLAVLAHARHEDQTNTDALALPEPPHRHEQEPEAKIFGENIRPSRPAGLAARPAQSKHSTDIAPIQVHLLGTYRVIIHGAAVGKGVRSKALELLAFYILHPQGAPIDAAIEALWPDAPPVRGHQRLWTVLGNLRSTVRAGLGRPEVDLLVREGDSYRFEPGLVGCDLWHFQSALTEAQRAGSTGDLAAETTALQAAAETYRGELLPGLDYLWVETPREELHRRALNAFTRLAHLHRQAGNPPAAAEALEQAIQVSPTTEELYRRLMRIQAPDRDAIKRTYQRLQATLAAELDAEPDPETQQLLAELLDRGSDDP